jgi:hypothetical protein
MTTRPTTFLDQETLVEREHEVAAIATQLELADSGWPGEGSRADIARLQGARHLAWMRWLVDDGQVSDG